MKTFEISKRKYKNGRRKFTVVLHEIYPDNVVDVEAEQGTVYNVNGITWIREYCENAINSIEDMSLRVEFLDDDRTEISGHGETGIVDGLPIFENAVEIGHFTNGYIKDVTDEDGVTRTLMMADGYIDEMCYKNFVDKLESDIANDAAPYGSVEIYRADGKDAIEYKYGYKANGRIPETFIYSGYALLGVAPADKQARIIELNNQTKEDTCQMNEAEIVSLVKTTVEEMNAHIVEINKCKEECEARVAEANNETAAAVAEKNEAVANSAQIQTALDEAKAELEAKYAEISTLYEELEALRKELGAAKARERIGEMNAAIANFSDEERAYAQDEIDAFTADPVTSEINTIVDKIYKCIGEKAKADADAHAAAAVSETNAAKAVVVEDIFSEVTPIVVVDVEDNNIF